MIRINFNSDTIKFNSDIYQLCCPIKPKHDAYRNVRSVNKFVKSVLENQICEIVEILIISQRFSADLFII